MEENRNDILQMVRDYVQTHKKLCVLAGLALVLVICTAGCYHWLNQAPEIPNRPVETPSDTPQPSPAPGPSGNEGTDPEPGKDPAGSTAQNPENPIRELKRRENFYTFVVAGTNDGYNTDTNLLGGIDVNTHKVTLMSIPRDSMVDRDVKYRKINNAYGRAGVEEFKDELEELTGVYPDFYCVLNLKAFVKIVDLVGGVEFNVPYDMYHQDGISTIDLKKGLQVLDGEKALQLVRFRGTSANDFGRTQVQRDFIAAMLRQVTGNMTLSNITGILDAVVKNLKTDMDVQNMLWFFTNVISKMDFGSDLFMTVAPTEGTGKYKGQDYVYLDPQGVVDTVNSGINPYTVPLIVEDLHIVNLRDPK